MILTDEERIFLAFTLGSIWNIFDRFLEWRPVNGEEVSEAMNSINEILEVLSKEEEEDGSA